MGSGSTQGVIPSNGAWGYSTQTPETFDTSTLTPNLGSIVPGGTFASVIQPGVGVGIRDFDDFARSDRNLSGDIAPSGRTYGTFGTSTLPIISGNVYRINQARGAGGNCFIVLDHGFQVITRLRGEAIFYPAVGGTLLGTSRVVLNASRHVYTRTDAGCTVTSGSSTVLDPSVKATDYGSGVSGGGVIPGSSFMVNIVPGVSFDLADVNKAAVLATGNLSGNLSVTSPSLSKASVQPWISRTKYGLLYNDFGVQHDVIGPTSFPTPLTADGLTRYPFEMEIDLVNSIVTCTFPQVGKVSATNAEFATRWGNYSGFQLDPTLNDFGDVGFASISCSGPTSYVLGQQVAYSAITSNATVTTSTTVYTEFTNTPSITLPNDGNLYRIAAEIPGMSLSVAENAKVAIWDHTNSLVLAGKTVNFAATTPNFGSGAIEAQQIIGRGQTIDLAGIDAIGASRTMTILADSGTSLGPCTLAAYLVGWGTGSP